MSVTVALLCWNQAPFAAEAVRSIAEQDHDDLKVIIIDNGSTDGSQEILRNEVNRSQMVVEFIENGHNVGIATALNQALSKSNTKYFVPFASDDVMLAGRLSRQFRLFETLPATVAVLSSSCRVIDHEGRLGPRISGSQSTDMRRLRLDLIRRITPPAPGVMIRTSALRDLGGYDERCPLEDYDLWVRVVFDLGMAIYPDPTEVALYRRHGSNSSLNEKFMTAGVAYSQARIRRHDLSLGERKELRRAVFTNVWPATNWHLTIRALEDGEVHRARFSAFRALGDAFLSPGQRAKLVFVVLFPRTAMRRIRLSDSQ